MIGSSVRVGVTRVLFLESEINSARSRLTRREDVGCDEKHEKEARMAHGVAVKGSKGTSKQYE